MKVSTILSAAVAASLFWSCALGFDTTLPGDASLAGDVDVMGDTDGEGDIDSVSDVQLDGNVSDADSASDMEVERDADVVIDADGGIDADMVPDTDVEGDIMVDVEADDGGSDGDTEAGNDADVVDATDSGDAIDSDDAGSDGETTTGSDADVELDVDVVSGTDECALRTEPICTGANNVCVDTSEGYECSCATGSTGTTVTGGNATCTLEDAGLGGVCLADSQCPDNSWCSTVSDFRRCSPRLSLSTVAMEFVFVPAGTFEQGSDAETSADERPYTATISQKYFVSRTEVTQGQWKAATGGMNGSCFQTTSGTTCTASNSNDNGPVESVDWYSALAYANALSVSQGLSECYTLTPADCADDLRDWATGDTACTGATLVGLTCTGYRLLTESEWERAARGNTTSTYYWGEASDTATVGLYAWFRDNSELRTQPVGMRQANAFGLYDMSGNVSEWVWDVYVAAYPVGSETDYLGPTPGSMRGHRGGSLATAASSLYLANRSSLGPSSIFNEVGFRLARTAP